MVITFLKLHLLIKIWGVIRSISLYKIELGKKSKISKISFIGDKRFKDSTLKNIIISEEYKFWKFLSGKKYLNKNLINYDKRLLNNFYKNKGFFNVIIESSFANYLGE